MGIESPRSFTVVIVAVLLTFNATLPGASPTRLLLPSRSPNKMFVLSRIFVEDEGVVGNGLFAARRTPDNFGAHLLGNVLRVLLIIIFSPFYLIYLWRRVRIPIFLTPPTPAWDVEFAQTPHAFLAASPSSSGNEHGAYQPSTFDPTWVLEVDYGTRQWRQVQWKPGMQYSALSYAYDSAEEMARRRIRQRMPGEPIFLEPGTYHPNYILPGGKTVQTRHDELIARQASAREFLLEFIESRRQNHPGISAEYIWLDEFCLYDGRIKDVTVLSGPRDEELGRLADIFRAAEKVYVFCGAVGCRHIDSACAWGNRLFTLAEIIHANKVVRMTFAPNGSMVLDEEDGRFFRDRLQAQAAKEGKWHLYGIMQHASNSGTASWQTAIHSLIVEAIRRDEAGGFKSHRYLGKGLNGLLPRRARVQDLGGQDGWADLAWLLELNQGFYNAASLAAVCGMADAGPTIPDHYWLGPPVNPGIGNERLEPCVTAFPIPSALNVLTPLTIKVHHTLKRDPFALYRVAEVRRVLRLAQVILVALILSAFVAFFMAGATTCAVVLYFAFVSHVLFVISVGSMYIHKIGWVVLRDEQWSSGPSDTRSLESWLGHRDHRFSRIDEWGYKHQLAPKWHCPNQAKMVRLVDLEHNVSVDGFFLYSTRINVLVPLAIHGSGVTCMVLERAHQPGVPSVKVGMVNMPPYVRIQGEVTGSLHVGRPRDYNKVVGGHGSRQDQNKDVRGHGSPRDHNKGDWGHEDRRLTAAVRV